MARLKDVAAKAGVSICTVSRVLNGNHVAGRISAATVDRVLAAAGAVAYRPNYHARSLQTGAARAVGLLMDCPRTPGEASSFYGQMILGVDMEARRRGYDFLIVGQGSEESIALAGLRYLRERRVDCLVIPGYQYLARSSPELHSAGLPAVLVHYAGATPLPVVEVDDAAGVRAAVEHLAGLGHRDVLWLGPAGSTDTVAGGRRDAFRKAARAAGVRPTERPYGPAPDDGRTSAAARAAMAAALRERGAFTAVVCYNERAAFAAYAAVRQAGLCIPEDVSVVGFDDIHAHVADPPMTVASHMLGELGRRAAAIAIEMAADPKALRRHAGKRHRVASELVVRSSTAAPRAR